MACDLSERILSLWRERFPNYDDEQPDIRYLPDRRCPTFIVIFHPSRERLQRLDKEPPSGDPRCPLDVLISNAGIRFGNWTVTPNSFPVQREHILLVSNEHRAKPTAEDILDGLAFTGQTGFRLFLNLSGAGATIPDHLHWQGLRVNFPVFREEYAGVPLFEDVELEAHFLEVPWGGFRLRPRSEEGRARIAQAIVGWAEPFNLLLRDSTAYLFPRRKEFSAMYPKFKFGGAEVAGILYAKTRAMFRDADERSLISAMKEVVMQAEERESSAARLAELLS